MRWYPRTWRERYGDEFVDHLEQEIDDRPHDINRTLNVIYKGLGTRLGELGVFDTNLDPTRHARAAVASTFAASGVFLAVALNYWSSAMINWNGGPHPSSILATWCTGAITVLVAAMALGVLALFLSLLAVAARRLVRRQAKGATVPLALVLASSVYLIYAARESLHYVVARGGIAWGHPGWAIKQLAGVCQAVTSSVYLAWMSPNRAFDPGSNFVNALMPIFLVALCLGVATLIRRMELSGPLERVGRAASRTLGAMMAAFMLVFLLLTLSGGTGDVMNFAQPLRPWILIVELIVMSLMALAGLSSARQLRHRHESLAIEAD